ncbi:MAG: class II fructose-bisphosphate aldolase [Treponema sp.]|nr:class II fructose-bisphosphate aldolase [Treponema sp.]
MDHIAALYRATGIPLVLHGGSGIRLEYIRRGIKAGIAKINVGTEIRQAYEKGIEESGGNVEQARERLYRRVRELITDMEITGSRKLLSAEPPAGPAGK